MHEHAQTFSYRLDTYWRSLAIYAVALLLYGLGRSLIAGTIQSDGKIEVLIADPIFWLLALFVLVSSVALVVNVVLSRRLTITPEAIIYATRFRSRRLERSLIRRIIISRERAGWQRLRSIRIYLRGRRFPIRLRPSAYERDRELVEVLSTYLHQSGSPTERRQ
jgi:hypothetical protein